MPAPTASTPPSGKPFRPSVQPASEPPLGARQGRKRPCSSGLCGSRMCCSPWAKAHFVPGYFIELWIRGLSGVQLRGRCGRYARRAVSQESDIARDLQVLASTTLATRLFRPEDGPAPGTPHPTGRPNGFPGSHQFPEKLIEIESLLPDRPWLAPNATITRGNNCIAYRRSEESADGSVPGDVDGKSTARAHIRRQV